MNIPVPVPSCPKCGAACTPLSNTPGVTWRRRPFTYTGVMTHARTCTLCGLAAPWSSSVEGAEAYWAEMAERLAPREDEP